MDYILTFEDGSEVLAHHGIKGMKWGVWNAETRARHNGGIREAAGRAKENRLRQKSERASDKKAALLRGEKYSFSEGHRFTKIDKARTKAEQRHSEYEQDASMKNASRVSKAQRKLEKQSRLYQEARELKNYGKSNLSMPERNRFAIKKIAKGILGGQVGAGLGYGSAAWLLAAGAAGSGATLAVGMAAVGTVAGVKGVRSVYQGAKVAVSRPATADVRIVDDLRDRSSSRQRFKQS